MECRHSRFPRNWHLGAHQESNRFRWAVCQIDALQRLKPDTGIIKAALDNLPRTLDETYERVFLRIPEEARLFVQHALHWMSTHRLIHQAILRGHRTLSCDLSPIHIPYAIDIPCDVLFRAVREGLAREGSWDTMFLSGYVLDEELLRELCGCLITVTRYPIRSAHSTTYEIPVVSFAHYTVLEFLESSRIRSGPAAHFVLDRERVMVEHATILLRGAVDSADRWSRELPQHPGPEFYCDFDRYCAHSSALLLHWQAGLLASSRTTTWMTSVVQLLEPRASSIKGYFWYTPEILVGLENPIAPAIRAFRQTLTLRVLSMLPEPHLGTLVRMLQLDEQGDLAQKFLATKGWTSDTLAYQLDLEFQPGVFYQDATSTVSQVEYGVRSAETLRFRGSILEFYAHLPPVTRTNPGQGLHRLLEFTTGHFDPSTLMLLSSANHEHNYNSSGAQCWGCLVLTQLLRLGAQPTVPGFAVGSLQIAVARRDRKTACLLLEAGVDANGIGDLNGEIGTPERGPMLKWFKSIRGRSPLNIAKDQHFTLLNKTNSPRDGDEFGRDEQLEAMLVQHGGRDFVISLDEDVSFTTKMEEVKISEGGREDILVTQHEEREST